MRLTGEARDRWQINAPLIGVAAWGAVHDKKLINLKLAYPARPASSSGASLNPHHTHFVLVDNGTQGSASWGSEILLRASLENHIRRAKRVPSVQIVVQGGAFTLHTVLASAYTATPIILLVDSGGAARAIYDFCESGLSAGGAVPRRRPVRAAVDEERRGSTRPPQPPTLDG